MVDETFNEVEQNTYGTIEIKYTRPKFAHRVLANFIDFFIFALVFVGTFLITRGIVNKTEKYKTIFNEINQMRLDSGLYVDSTGTGYLLDIVSYMRQNTDNYNDNARIIRAKKSINQFFTFEEGLISDTKLNSILEEYDKVRLDAMYEDENKHLFLKVDDEIVENEEIFNKRKYPFAEFYCNYIDKYLHGYLTSTPKYYDDMKTISNYLLWVELPVSFVVAFFISYPLPTFIFIRGRKTWGKALYHIGTVDQRFLSPTFGRNLAKWGIFFLEFIAGIASIGVIFIISVSMMAYSKLRQGFPDYMLGLQEVDISKNKIYKDLIEAKMENVSSYKKASDFRLIDHP